MLFISLDRKVCLSEPRLNSVSLVANAVVLRKRKENTEINVKISDKNPRVIFVQHAVLFKS